MKIHGRFQSTWFMSLMIGGSITVGCGGPSASPPTLPLTVNPNNTGTNGTLTSGGTVTPSSSPTSTPSLASTGGNTNVSSDGVIATPSPASTPRATPIVHVTPTPSAIPIVSVSPSPSPTPSVPLPSLAKSLGINVSVDLRKYDSPIEDQFGGTCSAFGAVAAMDNVIHQKGINRSVSERDLWSLYGIYDADAAIEAASKHYVTDDTYWPTYGTKSKSTTGFESFEITAYQSHDYNLNAALKGLSAGHPSVFAIQVPESMANCDTMVDPKSKATDGEHVMAAVGYKLDDKVSGGGYFILKNSWGTDCGDKGYLYYPFSLCTRNDLYCYFVEIDDVAEKNF